jgi:KamA family protein
MSVSLVANEWAGAEGIFGVSQLDRIPQLSRLPPAYRFELQVVATVLPFRVSSHVLNNLIDWDRVPEDPVFRITFPQKEMLSPEAFEVVAAAIRRGAGSAELKQIAAGIQEGLNPHPGHQRDLNAGYLEDQKVDGIQHKYHQTVLYFPSEGQTCHAFCTFCFRWAQFVQNPDLRMAMVGNDPLVEYLRAHPQVTDVLITGGDPFVIKTRRLRALVEPLLSPDLAHVSTIRFGTKALSFHPERFLTDPDAEDLMVLLRTLAERGKHVAIMVHFNHWQELEQPLARAAIRRLRQAGAVLRSQSPLLRGVNDSPEVWARMWHEQVNLGIAPYYMFVARDTGAKSYFDVPLIEAWRIYTRATSLVSGLAKTARGPIMSATPGKVEFLGPVTVQSETVFALRFVQAREPAWCNQLFFAEADETASWFGDLRPAFGQPHFFFEASPAR